MNKFKFKIENLSQVFYAVLIVLVNLIQIMKITQNHAIESLLFTFSFILLIIAYLVKKIDDWFFSKFEVFTIVFLLLALISALISSFGISFQYLKKYIIFSSTVLCFLYAYSIRPKPFLLKILFFSAIFQLFVFFIAYYLGYGDLNTFNGLLTFGFDNPNFTGMWITFNIIIAFIGLFKIKRLLIIKVTTVFLILNNIQYLLLTGSRASLVGLMAFALLALLNFVFRKPIKIHPIFVVLVPVFIVLFYYMLFTKNFLSIFSFLESTGKTLDSRILIWNEALDTFFASPVFGNYKVVLYVLSFSQLHNAYFDVFVSYGFIVGIFFIIFLYIICIKIYKNLNFKSNGVVYYGILAMLIVMSFESSIISGSTGLYVMICSIVICLSCGELNEK